MHLGAFSVSLNVRDLAASRRFYEALGFGVFHDGTAQGYLILKSGPTVIGLFQGHIDTNMLTFNPGWDQDANPVAPFDDIREIQTALEDRGISADTRLDPAGTGPAEFVVTDPDGNRILIDQHVDRVPDP